MIKTQMPPYIDALIDILGALFVVGVLMSLIFTAGATINSLHVRDSEALEHCIVDNRRIANPEIMCRMKLNKK